MKSCIPRTRRDFLAEVGRGVLVATVGCELASDLGLAVANAEEAAGALNFGSLEPLVRLMQETPANALLPALVKQLESGKDLRQLVAAAAFANARTFGGEDYVGYHTMMALSPAYHMAQELPKDRQALPVFKVLYRNTNRIQERGGRKDEVLHEVKPNGASGGESLQEIVRRKDIRAAEQALATIARRSPEDAFNELLEAVQDGTEVHRVVLPYRAWDLLGIIGKEQAHTLLRQSVRYCVKAEEWQAQHGSDARTLLPKLLEEHKLLDRSPGNRRAEDAWIEELSETIFKASPKQAAAAAASALAEGMDPNAIGEAISLAANQLVL